jgi:hypothetical protein
VKRALDEAETADPEPSELTVRIGIHTGPVVFGPVADSLAMDYTVIGDTANVAARLQQATEPGTILVSDETCRLAQGYARFDLSRSGRSSSKQDRADPGLSSARSLPSPLGAARVAIAAHRGVCQSRERARDPAGPAVTPEFHLPIEAAALVFLAAAARTRIIAADLSDHRIHRAHRRRISPCCLPNCVELPRADPLSNKSNRPVWP